MGHDSQGALGVSAERKIDYPLGTSDFERQRLIRQAQKLRPITEDAFRAAGLAPGMRVLDVGCGAGDVAMLAGEIVGPTGRVVTIDRDPQNLAFARDRASKAGMRHVLFLEADMTQFTSDEPFDALVGRYILLYIPDRVAALRNLLRSVKSGGPVAFLEPDFTLPFRSEPHAPLLSKASEWARDVMRASGMNMDSGIALHRIFREVGLENIQMDGRQWVGGPESDVLSQLAGVIRSLSPAIVARGIATAEEIGIDTLEKRLIDEIRALNGIAFSYHNIAAWARKP
jgi:ubiquinone/menaquinone biosynthesis C-methylase UbiE